MDDSMNNKDRPAALSSHVRQHHRCKRPVPYLILTNISKRPNVRNLLQLAAAYGCPTIFVVGQRAFQFDLLDDDVNADDDDDDDDDGGRRKTTTDIPPPIQEGVRDGTMRIVKFDKLEDCVEHIKSIPCCDDEKMATTALGGGGCEVTRNVVEKSNNDATDTASKPAIPIIGVEIDNSSLNLEGEPFSTSVAFMMGNEGSGMTAKQMSVCDGFLRISQYGGGTASLNVSVAAGLVFHRFYHWSRGDAVQKYCDD